MALPQPDRMSGIAPAHVRHKPEQTLLYQLVLQMLAVGEEIGTTGELLAEVAEVADYYDREVTYSTDRLSAAIEPILTVVIGGMFLVLAMGIFTDVGFGFSSVALGFAACSYLTSCKPISTD